MKQADVLIKHACLITMNEKREIMNDGVVVVTNDRITAVGGPELEQEYRAGQVIDASGQAVLPGFISTHSHLFQTLLKGLGRDFHLIEWLNHSIRLAIKNFDHDMIYWAAIQGCAEAIHSGTTTILDYMYCHPLEGLDEMVLKAFEDIGIRGVLGRSFANVAKYPPERACPHVESEQDFIDTTRRLEKEYRDHSRISVCIAPGIIWDHTDDGFREMRRFANETGKPITMHIVETPDDDIFSMENYNERTIPHMERLGVLGPDFIGVHCVNMCDEDFAIFKENQVTVSHNPLSNMILASGVPPITRFVEEGFKVSIACDGSASNDTQNYLEGLKMASLLQKVYTRNPEVIPAAKALEMATIGGAGCLLREHDLGSLEVGKKADLFLYDPNTLFSAPSYDPITTIVYASTPSMITTVMVDGQIVMKDGVLTRIDEERARHEVCRQGVRLIEKSGLGNIQWGQKSPILPCRG